MARIEKSVRLFELEGVIEQLEETTSTDGYLGRILHIVGGGKMSLPHESNYDFPVVLDDGIPEGGLLADRVAKNATTVAVRSFLVPAVDPKTGAVRDAKRYVFAPDDGPIDLAHCMTREQYLETEYSGKPKGTRATTVVEAF